MAAAAHDDDDDDGSRFGEAGKVNHQDGCPEPDVDEYEE